MSSSLIDRILNSPFFRQAKEEAGKLGQDASRMGGVIEQVLTKGKELLERDPRGAAFLDQLHTLVRLLKAYQDGSYRETPWKSIGLLLAGFLYLLMPIDLVPDFLPIIGIADDLTLLFWIVKSLKEDLDSFRAWEKSKAQPIIHPEVN